MMRSGFFAPLPLTGRRCEQDYFAVRISDYVGRNLTVGGTCLGTLFLTLSRSDLDLYGRPAN
jgi:hypothetical protein